MTIRFVFCLFVVCIFVCLFFPDPVKYRCHLQMGRNNFNRDSERNQQSHFGHVKVEIPNRNRTGDMGS